MKTFKQKVQEVFAKLFGDKKAAKDLSPEEQAQFAAAYKEAHNSEFLDDYNKEKENAEKAAKFDAAFKAMGADEAADDTQRDEPKSEPDLAKKIEDLKKEKEALAAENKKKTDELEAKEEENKKLAGILEKDEPKTIEISMAAFSKHSKTHLFGIENDFFSLEKRWNRVMADPTLKPLSGSEDARVFADLQKEVVAFGESLAKRYQHLHSVGQLPKKGAAFTQTVTGLADAGLGTQFVVFRQDQLIARILELPNVYDIFPKRFGVQDKELMTNAFFGDFSQAFQTGAVYKGSMELQPEMGYVDDSMFKTLFESMKWLERVYIGYLNQEGSDPMKWSLIEWTLLNIATKLTMEQYERRIVGIYAKPVATEAGHYLHASTGFLYTLLRYVHENKLLPFTDSGFESYDNTGTAMVDLVVAFYDKLKASVDNFQESQYIMLLNANHRYWYRAQVRAKFGLQQDFTGPIDTVVPDTQLKIVWVPNMKQIKLICVTKPGNFQCLENLPGEMFNIQFQPDMEAVKAWSVWKEGFAGTYVGKKFSTLALLTANAFALQEVFMNKPATALAADATTAAAATNFWFKTVQNTGATDLTDFTGAVAGVAYILECGHLTNATTITKVGGKFSTITADWTPAAVGDYLMVVYDTAASKFFELERCVNGVRTVNALKQPNVTA